MDQELFCPRNTISSGTRWQSWVNRVYVHTRLRAKPLKFMVRRRCISEKCLSGNLVTLDADGNVWDGDKVVGRVSDYLLSGKK